MKWINTLNTMLNAVKVTTKNTRQTTPVHFLLVSLNVNYEHNQKVQDINIVFLFLTLNKYLFFHSRSLGRFALDPARKKANNVPVSLLLEWLVQTRNDFIVELARVVACYRKVSALTLKMMANAFCFILKALFILKIFKSVLTFWSCREKQLDYKDKVNFKIYDVTTWLINNYNTHIAQYLT